MKSLILQALQRKRTSVKLPKSQAGVQGRRISGGNPLCADLSEAKNEPCASQVRCHASRQTPACASTAGAFLKERANDGVRVLVKDYWKC